jgi:hypothetical protein
VKVGFQHHRGPEHALSVRTRSDDAIPGVITICAHEMFGRAPKSGSVVIGRNPSDALVN